VVVVVVGAHGARVAVGVAEGQSSVKNVKVWLIRAILDVAWSWMHVFA
jgi:hypothetical protein